jgi:hypothetical protein
VLLRFFFGWFFIISKTAKNPPIIDQLNERNKTKESKYNQAPVRQPFNKIHIHKLFRGEAVSSNGENKTDRVIGGG